MPADSAADAGQSRPALPVGGGGLHGDGIPDGIASADWAANTLWAANADDAANLVITLNETTIAPATLTIGNLAIPLANPASWSLRLVPGQMYSFRLHTQDNNPVDITLPTWIERTVTSCGAGAKGNTAAGNATKDAEVEGGYTLKVPLFVEEGDLIRIDTRTGEYADRVKR